MPHGPHGFDAIASLSGSCTVHVLRTAYPYRAIDVAYTLPYEHTCLTDVAGDSREQLS